MSSVHVCRIGHVQLFVWKLGHVQFLVWKVWHVQFCGSQNWTCHIFAFSLKTLCFWRLQKCPDIAVFPFRKLGHVQFSVCKLGHVQLSLWQHNGPQCRVRFDIHLNNQWWKRILLMPNCARCPPSSWMPPRDDMFWKILLAHVGGKMHWHKSLPIVKSNFRSWCNPMPTPLVSMWT